MSDTARSTDRASDRQPEQRLKRPGNSYSADKFRIDWDRIPKGMTAEFKRISLRGLADKRNMAVSEMNHWKPVPARMQPHLLGTGATNASPEAPIIIDDQMLMMRPTYLCEEADRERKNETDYVTQQQLDALRLQSRAQVGNFTKIKRSVEQVRTPQTID